MQRISALADVCKRGDIRREVRCLGTFSCSSAMARRLFARNDLRSAKLPGATKLGSATRYLRYPDLLPLRDIDPSSDPYSTVYRMRTEAGPLDIAFINQFGRLTLVECKLWRNPEARRKVVAQTLDYARAVSRWSYSDLQRQVAAASGRHGNVPFETTLAQNPGLIE